MTRHDEDMVFDILDSMNSEEMEKELQDIDYSSTMIIPKDSLERIKKTTFSNIGIRKIPNKKRWFGVKIAAAVLALTVAGSGLIGYGKVWAALKKTMEYIPSIGAVIEADDASDRYILNSPIKKDLGDKYVVLKGVTVENGKIVATLAGNNSVKPVESTTLIDKNGNRYNSTSLGGGSGETSSLQKWWIGVYEFDTNLESYDNLQIAIDGNTQLAIPFSLQKADKYENSEQIGPTVYNNGIGITTIVSEHDGILKVNYVTIDDRQNSKYKGYFGMGFPLSISDASLKDADGKEYKKAHGLSMDASGIPDLNALYFDLEGCTKKDFRLSIPSVFQRGKNMETVTIDIPNKGDTNLNRAISLSGYSFDIKTVKRISDKYIALLFDTHYDGLSNDYLGAFSAYHAKDYGIDIASAQGNDEVSVDQAIQDVLNRKDTVYYYLYDKDYPRKMIMKAAIIPIKPKMQSIDLIFDAPLVSKTGPWEFDIKLN